MGPWSWVPATSETGTNIRARPRAQASLLCQPPPRPYRPLRGPTRRTRRRAAPPHTPVRPHTNRVRRARRAPRAPPGAKIRVRRRGKFVYGAAENLCTAPRKICVRRRGKFVYDAAENLCTAPRKIRVRRRGKFVYGAAENSCTAPRKIRVRHTNHALRRRCGGVRLGVPECGRVHNSNHHDRADQNFGLNTCK